jgi:hypothetical protein
MEAILEIPKNGTEQIVITGQMHRAARRLLAIHRGLGVLHGRARLGKTETAKWIAGEVNQQFDPDEPGSYRALHYECGEIPPRSGQEQKQGIRSLYHAAIGRLDEGQYRQLPAEDLARQLVYGLRRKHVQLILVDEAGCLSVNAIRGMVLVSDVADNLDWTLNLIFVGMDDLPTKLCRLPQIEKRIHEWIYYEAYSLDETWELLAALHPHFKKLDGKVSSDRQQVEFIHETLGGIPGEIVPYLRRLNSRMDDPHTTIDLTLLKAIHLMLQIDKNRALKDSRSKYRGQLPDDKSKSVPTEKGKK